MAERENAEPGPEERQGGPEHAPGGFFIRSRFIQAPTLPGGLYVVATPIGNLGDVTIRALDTLAGADLVACEDTRVTRKLLTRYGIETRTAAYHDHSGPAAQDRLLRALAEGASVALVSDAGTPLVSDPGYPLIVAALAAKHRVVPIPGASAATAALSAAGLPTDSFLFAGFLSSKSAARRTRLAELGGVAATLVLFESPNRIGALLADAASVLGGERPAVVCRELTKLHETIDRGSLADLAARYGEGRVKGEIVLAIAPPGEEPAPAEADVYARLRDALGSMSVKEAAQAVAAATGLPRRDLYRRALTLKKEV